MSRPEISQLYIAILIDEDGSRFEIADDNPFGMGKSHSAHNLDGESLDDTFGEGLVLLYQFEEISAGTVLGDSPHVVFGLYVLKEFDDVGVFQLLEDLGLVDNFLFAGFVHAFDGNKFQFLLSAGFEDDGVFAFGLLLVDVIFVHLNYKVISVIYLNQS